MPGFPPSWQTRRVVSVAGQSKAEAETGVRTLDRNRLQTGHLGQSLRSENFPRCERAVAQDHPRELQQVFGGRVERT